MDGQERWIGMDIQEWIDMNGWIEIDGQEWMDRKDGQEWIDRNDFYVQLEKFENVNEKEKKSLAKVLESSLKGDFKCKEFEEQIVSR